MFLRSVLLIIFPIGDLWDDDLILKNLIFFFPNQVGFSKVLFFKNLNSSNYTWTWLNTFALMQIYITKQQLPQKGPALVLVRTHWQTAKWNLFNMWQLPWVQGGFADCPVMMNRTPRYLRASDGHMLIHCPTLKTINPQLNPSSTEKPINLHCNPLLSLKFPPDQQKNTWGGPSVGEHGGSGLTSLLSLFKTGKI